MSVWTGLLTKSEALMMLASSSDGQERLCTHDFVGHPFLTELQHHPVPLERDQWPKISIVMPSFNQCRFIERSILSVLNQDYPRIELIIMDGGSTDGTIDIIKKYEALISLWISEPDQGQSDALNKGFQRCTGDIYGWLNSDDLYLPGAFRQAVQTLSACPTKKIVFGDWLSIDSGDRTLDYNHAFDFSLGHFQYEGFHLNAQSMFWRAEVHRVFSGYDVGLYNTMDYQMILEFGITHGQEAFVRVPQPLGAFRRYEGQKTGGMAMGVIKEHHALAKRYGYLDKYRTIGKFKRLYFRVRRAVWYVRRGGLANLMFRLNVAYRTRG